jgi:hypothetical protein
MIARYSGPSAARMLVAELLVLLLPDEVLDELVAAHPDRAVDAPQRDDELVLAERPEPGDAWW